MLFLNRFASFRLIALLFLASSLARKLADHSFRQRFFSLVTRGDRLTVNVISSHTVNSVMDCSQKCMMQATCVAFNYRSPRTTSNEANCQLTNTTGGAETDDVKDNDRDWLFYKALDIHSPLCLKNPCKNGGECVPDAREPAKRFSCKCGVKYKGELCDVEKVFKSCHEVFKISSGAQNGNFEIKIKNTTGINTTKIYCQMTSLLGCSGGGWTMVMKINGTKNTFKYSSTYWNNKQSYNLAGGLSAFDDQETKLPTYWSTSFNEMCVGMKVGNDLNFVNVSYPASSLHSLIADGNVHKTYLAREQWLSLIRGSGLQLNCNKEGLNVKSDAVSFVRVRLGIIGNNEIDCRTADSFLGLGGQVYKHKGCPGIAGGFPSVNAAGNLIACSDHHTANNTRAMGYILVR